MNRFHPKFHWALYVYAWNFYCYFFLFETTFCMYVSYSYIIVSSQIFWALIFSFLCRILFVVCYAVCINIYLLAELCLCTLAFIRYNNIFLMKMMMIVILYQYNLNFLCLKQRECCSFFCTRFNNLNSDTLAVDLFIFFSSSIILKRYFFL